MFAVFQVVKKLMSAWQHIKLGCIFAVMAILVPLSEADNLAQSMQLDVCRHLLLYFLDKKKIFSAAKQKNPCLVKKKKTRQDTCKHNKFLLFF